MSKEGIKVSFINRHETWVDDVVIKVGLTHGDDTKDWTAGKLKVDNLQTY